MTNGVVFDIKEFAVHDGPGIRTTVFLKGCPLRCTWCHNPEGLAPEPQLVRSPAGERVAGRVMDAEQLAALLRRQAPLLRDAGGGVTFSGGEPLMQPDFVLAVIERLNGLHVLLDTAGHAPPGDFERVARRVNLVYFDIKLIDPELHQRYTGQENGPILENLRLLGELGTPWVLRVPLIPGVTDSTENLSGIVALLGDLDRAGLQGIDLLPYNRLAGAKYRAAGMRFQPGFDEEQPVMIRPELFSDLGVEVRIR